MAFQVTLVADCTPPGTAAVDLSAHKNKFVSVFPAGVNLSDQRSLATGVYVLQNEPTSGKAVSVMGAPSIAKVIAGQAIAVGQWVEPMSASGLAQTSTVGSLSNVGVAWTSAAGSGEYVVVKLHR